LFYEGPEIAEASPLSDLDQLAWLSLSGNQVNDVSPLADLDSLQYLYLHDNRIGDVAPLAGERLLDNGSLPEYVRNGSGVYEFTGNFKDAAAYTESAPPWLGNIDRVVSAYEGDYRFHAPRDGSIHDANAATWQFTGLAPGSYELFATWPEDAGLAPRATYSVHDGSPDEPHLFQVDQQTAPSDEALGGQPWDKLGVVNVTCDPADISAACGDVRVGLSASDYGLVAADAVRLRAFRSPTLLGLTLNANPLNNAAHEMYLDELDVAISENWQMQGNQGPPAFFSFDPNRHAPVIKQTAPQSPIGRDTAERFPVMLPGVGDIDGDTVFLTAQSSHDDVVVTTEGGIHIELSKGEDVFQGTAIVQIAPHDGPSGPTDWRGRSGSTNLEVSFFNGAVYGTKFEDTDGDGVHDPGEPVQAGVLVYLDDGDGVFQPGEPSTYTDANGQYVFRSLAPGDYVVREVVPAGQIQTYPAIGGGPPSGGGTTRLTDFFVEQMYGPVLGDFAPLDGKLYFAANDGNTGRELWRYDPATKETQQVADINPGEEGSDPRGLTVVSGQLFFAASEPEKGQELWRYDPVADAVKLIADIRDGLMSSMPMRLTALGGELLFLANDGTTGHELWRHKPATANTELVADIRGGSTGSFALDLVPFQDKLFFRADDGFSGLEPWKYDAATGVVSRVADIRVGRHSSSPDSFTVVGDQLYFAADDGRNGRELWEYDPSIGAQMAADINPGSGRSLPNSLTSFDGSLFFRANNGNTGEQIWQYDPAAQTANQITNLQGGRPGYALIGYESLLYFTADDGSAGEELWFYDPTSGKVTQVADIRTGSSSSRPEDLIGLKGLLYFTADDGISGLEFWTYDPSTDSVSQLADIRPGPLGLLPRGEAYVPMEVTVFNDELFFIADDGTTGVELWKHTPADGGGNGGDGGHQATLASGQVITRLDFGNRVVVEAGLDQLADEGDTIQLSAMVHDPDPANGSDFDYTWEVQSDNGQNVPAGAELDFNFTAEDDGTYVAMFTATDLDDANTDYETQLVILVDNVLPHFDLGDDRNVRLGDTVTFAPTVLDPGAKDPQTYAWHVVADQNQAVTFSDPTQPTLDFTPGAFGTYTVTLTVGDDGGTASDEVQVVVAPPGTIRGTKWNDLNRNGRRDAGEPGLDGWTIELTDDDGTVLRTTTTGSMDLNHDGQIDPFVERGLYWFEDILVGAYRVREVKQQGWDQTFPEIRPGRLFAVIAGSPASVVEIDPLSGLEINRFVAPASVDPSSGVAFDGHHLFFVNGSDVVWKSDPDTGAVMDVNKVPGFGGFDAAAVLNGRLYLRDAGD